MTPFHLWAKRTMKMKYQWKMKKHQIRTLLKLQLLQRAMLQSIFRRRHLKLSNPQSVKKKKCLLQSSQKHHFQSLSHGINQMLQNVPNLTTGSLRNHLMKWKMRLSSIWMKMISLGWNWSTNKGDLRIFLKLTQSHSNCWWIVSRRSLIFRCKVPEKIKVCFSLITVLTLEQVLQFSYTFLQVHRSTKTLSAAFAWMENAKTVMSFSSATCATSPFIKNVTVFRTFPKASGYAEDACSLLHEQLIALCVPIEEEPSNKRMTTDGPMSFALCGYQKSASPIL